MTIASTLEFVNFLMASLAEECHQAVLELESGQKSIESPNAALIATIPQLLEFSFQDTPTISDTNVIIHPKQHILSTFSFNTRIPLSPQSTNIPTISSPHTLQESSIPKLASYKPKSVAPLSPMSRIHYLDNTFSLQLTRLKEKRAANTITSWWRSFRPKQPPSMSLMLRAIQNNKTIKSEVKALRKELELARKRSEAVVVSSPSPYRGCRLLLPEPLVSPGSLEGLLTLLKTDISAIRATRLNREGTQIAIVLCLTRVSREIWENQLKDLPSISSDSSFPTEFNKNSWAQQFEDAVCNAPVWTNKPAPSIPPVVSCDVEKKVDIEEMMMSPVDSIKAKKVLEKMKQQEGEEEEVESPTVKRFVDRMKSSVEQSRAVDNDTMHAFAKLGGRKVRGGNTSYSWTIDK